MEDYGNDAASVRESGNSLNPESDSDDLNEYATVQNVQPLINAHCAVLTSHPNRRGVFMSSGTNFFWLFYPGKVLSTMGTWSAKD